VTFRLAARALISRPIRSAVLVCGFGFGIAVMAALLGVGEVILEQARSPALRGGGDVVVSGANGEIPSARFVLSSLLRGPALGERSVASSPSTGARLYLIEGDEVTAIDVRGGIPSLEKAMGDLETSGVESWRDAPGDLAWTSPDPAGILREMDRFHAIPDVAHRAESWAEWLYFNGSAGETRFYLSFIVGPRVDDLRRRAVVRLQLERNGQMTTYSETAEVDEGDLLARAPDIRIGRSEVRLEGQRYRATLRLGSEGTSGPGSGTVEGEIVLRASPGRSLPPFTVRGARGWMSGYVVPVLLGTIEGTLHTPAETISLDGGTGYHDHNWGFWEGVTWHWGQVAHDDLSFVWGRILPPGDAADPERVPGFLGVLGPDGPLGFSSNVKIIENRAASGEPRTIRVVARGGSLRFRMDLEIDSVVSTRVGSAATSEGRDLDFLQMRALYRVDGEIGSRRIEFEAPGAAETFVDRSGYHSEGSRLNPKRGRP
jgi:hypothetical protein